MGFFKYIGRLRIEHELKEQRFFFDELFKNDIEQFRKNPHTPQETEAQLRKWEMDFRNWFIQNYILPKYFAKSIPPWV